MTNENNENQQQSQPEQNSDNKTMMTISIIGAILTGFLVPLIIWAIKKDSFSPEYKKASTDILNFELVLFIGCIIINFIPILGFLASLGIWVFNLIVCIQALSAVSSGKEYKYPIGLQLIK